MGAAGTKVIIISGLSGSGKSIAIKCFEDMGFYCVDNLPSELVPKFVELCSQSDRKISGVALGIDVRERDFLAGFNRLYEQMRDSGQRPGILFLEASDEVLARRFSESRRPHPLARKGQALSDTIKAERKMMEEARKKADRIIDTSGLTVHQLKAELAKHYMPGDGGRNLTVSVTSFGFKYGVPYDADLVFDVRFLPNPNFVPPLKELTGKNRQVQEFVRKNEVTSAFMRRLTSLLHFLLPLYEREGKTYLTIAVGCTGGRHRSVAVAEMLRRKMKDKGVDLVVRHRDVDR